MRPVREADAVEIAAWAARDLPVPPELAAELPALLERLIADEALRGMCVEDVDGDGLAGRLRGVGISGFVSDACVASYLDDPFPHLEVALLERARVPGSDRGFINIEEIAEANALGGLSLCLLFWLHHSNALPDAERHALLSLGQQCSLRAHRGREIAASLGTNANAVAQHWRKVYLRVEREIPVLLNDLPAGEGARGAEKRRRVVAYVAEHPEELRPYAGRKRRRRS